MIYCVKHLQFRVFSGFLYFSLIYYIHFVLSVFRILRFWGFRFELLQRCLTYKAFILSLLSIFSIFSLLSVFCLLSFIRIFSISSIFSIFGFFRYFHFFLLFYKILVLKTLFYQTLQVTEGFFLFLSLNRLSYYNVTTMLVDLVGLCWLKQNLVEKRS